MVSIAQVLLPMFAAAALVFIASSLIHMVFRWHNSDYLKLPNEDEVAAAIRKAKLAPGQYVMPHCLDMKAMQAPEMQQKFKDGPVGFLLLRPNGAPNMGPSLGQWFALNVVVAAIVACIAATTLAAGSPAGRVFHVTGLISFIAYAGGSVTDGIWHARPWRAVAKDLLDALIYGAVSGAGFALLWPGVSY